MKIAMLTADLPTRPRSGVAYQASRLANELASRGHEVTVFSFDEPPSGATYRVRRIKVPAWLVESAVARLIARPCAFACQSYAGFDVIHAHGDDFLLLGRKPPRVRTFYGSAREEARHARTVKRKLSQRLLHVGERVSRRVATVSVGISENTCGSIGSLDAVIPCGVDREHFRPGQKSHHPSILFVGTLGGRKRGHLVVEAFGQVRQRFPNCELWLVTDEEVTGDGIVYWGRVSDALIARLFREAWVVTLPSTYEGFGVPYLEAMASGTAVVATWNAGAAELLCDTHAGIVADDAEVASAIVALLENGSYRRDFERRGRAASARFDWRNIATEYEHTYALALARAGNGRETRPDGHG